MDNIRRVDNRKPIVIKVGTALVTKAAGKLNRNWLKEFIDQVSKLYSSGYKPVIVSSGAIAAGVEALGLKQKPSSIDALQAAAAIGQGRLFSDYALNLSRHELVAAQVLLTQFDTMHRQQFLNAKKTLTKLLKIGAVPIVNENDTTAVDEIKFGDNDTLSALVAVLVEAGVLILLTDIDGLYTKDPRQHQGATLIRTVKKITPEIERMAEGVGSRFASGGMLSKIYAAKIAVSAKIGVIIANGRHPEILSAVVKGKPIGTYFKPKEKKISSKKIWIGFGRLSQGTIYVDKGAVQALKNTGCSLLAAGVVKVNGNFSVGDTVSIATDNGKVFARGLTNYSSQELQQAKGRKTRDLAGVTSGNLSEEVIHRDCLVIL